MSLLEPGKPCLMCGVRADIACRHRPAEAPIVRVDKAGEKRGAHDGLQGLRWKLAKRRGRNADRA
jgi:hypothetical protein